MSIERQGLQSSRGACFHGDHVSASKLLPAADELAAWLEHGGGGLLGGLQSSRLAVTAADATAWTGVWTPAWTGEWTPAWTGMWMGEPAGAFQRPPDVVTACPLQIVLSDL